MTCSRSRRSAPPGWRAPRSRPTRFGVAARLRQHRPDARGAPRTSTSSCVSVRPAVHHERRDQRRCAPASTSTGAPGRHQHRAGARYVGGRAGEQRSRSVTGHESTSTRRPCTWRNSIRRATSASRSAFSATHFGANYITPRPHVPPLAVRHRRAAARRYRSGHSLERILAVLGQDITAVCADFTIQVPERQALDQPDAVLRSDQVDNMNYLLRAGSTAVGTLQVSNTAWFGTGDRLEVYGTEGMLLLADEAAVRALGGPGDPGGGPRLPAVRRAGRRRQDRGRAAAAGEAGRVPADRRPRSAAPVYPAKVARPAACGPPGPSWQRRSGSGARCAPSLRHDVQDPPHLGRGRGVGHVPRWVRCQSTRNAAGRRDARPEKRHRMSDPAELANDAVGIIGPASPTARSSAA